MSILDKETAEQLSDAEEVRLMTEGRGWGVVFPKLTQRIMDLQNMANLDLSQPDTLNTQVAARLMAVEMIYDWLKNDVTGFVEQQKANADALIDNPGQEYIERG